MVTMAGTMLWWYCLTTILITNTWSFPDSAIGKKYILARTNNGYELVQDGTNVPGIKIPISSVNVQHNSKPQHDIRIKPDATARITPPAPPSTTSDHLSNTEKDLLKEHGGSTEKESIVTLALQGRDGLNGKRGPKGLPGSPGPVGRQGAPGLKGEAGTCKTPEFQCDTNTIRSLTTRISELEKTCSKLIKVGQTKVERSIARPGNS